MILIFTACIRGKHNGSPICTMSSHVYGQPASNATGWKAKAKKAQAVKNNTCVSLFAAGPKSPLRTLAQQPSRFPKAGRPVSLTEEAILLLKKRKLVDGWSYARICEEFGITESYACAIVKGRRRAKTNRNEHLFEAAVKPL